MAELIRQKAEIKVAQELNFLKEKYKNVVRPVNWHLPPEAVLTFLLGSDAKDEMQISPKYFGDRSLIEVMIATLLSDRSLLIIGVPGTAKTWIAEHLTAAISGDSELIVQGTSGTSEESLRYAWNYAQLLAHGPSDDALIKSPIFRAMEDGKIARIEELSRIPSEVQDALISILSEKTISIPELRKSIHAVKGFNIIATANHLDRGVYDMSSALRRRFNIVLLPLPYTLADEVKIVSHRSKQLEQDYQLTLNDIKQSHIERLVTLFREMRNGKTEDGKQKFKQSKANLSPAEAISIVHHAKIQSSIFKHDEIHPDHFVQGIKQALGQHQLEEMNLLEEYNELVIKKRSDWKDWYNAIKKSI